MTQPKPVPANVYIMLLLGMLSFSFAPILVRLAQQEDIPSLTIAGLRLVIAAVIITPLVISRHRADLRNLKANDLLLALASGFFLAVHFASWVTSLEYTSVLLSVVFVTSSPLWVALLEYFFLKTRLARPVIMGLFIAAAGGLLIGFAGETPAIETLNTQNDLLGGALSLLGAIAVACYLIIGRKLRAKMPVVPYVWLVYGCAGLLLSISILLTGTPVTGYSSEGYLWLLAMAVFPQLIGHSSLNYAVGYLPATLVSMITQLEPIGSAILAFLLFSETPLPLQIVGSLVILSGVMLANIGQARKKKASLPE